MVKTVFIFFTALLCLAGCSSGITSFEAGNQDSPRRILIAAEDSGFKTAVITGLIESLGSEDWYYNVIGLDDVRGEDPNRYGAVVLVSKVAGGRLNSSAKDFLRTHREDPKIIVFLTMGKEGPVPAAAAEELREVDALASASKFESVGEKVSGLAELIKERY